MEDLAPQLGGILVGDASGDESGPQGTLDPGGISVPVTLVLSSSLPEQADLESQSSTMLNTLALHTGDGAPPTTQFFLEQCADGRTRLKTAEGHILEVDIDPGTFGLVQGNSGLPVLLQVSTDSTLVHRDSVQIAVTASGTGAAHVTRSTEEQRKKHGSNVAACDETEEPMFRDLCKECVENSEPFDGQQLPLQMYLQVGKETVDENSTPLEDGGQANTSTAVAIVTPDGDESDADELPTPNVVQRVERVERLEDFMDVVTTYHCKFCSFSCAWRSGVMSHFRSCHVAPSGSGCLDPIEPPVNSSHKIRPGTKVSRTGSSAVAFALTTAVDSSAAELVLKAPVEPPEPPPRVPASMPVSEVASKPTSDTVPSRVPMDASLVLENALASMASTGSSEVLPSSSFSKSTGEGGQQVPAQERHIFICGQCSQGFGSLDDCKEHMVEAHDLKVGADPDAEAKKGTTTRKRGRPRCTAHLSESPSGTASVTTTGSDVIAGALQSVDDRDLEDGSNEALGKRRVRPPKNLEDDYLVAPVRRRRAKKENAAERQYRCGERSCGYRFRTEQSLEYHVRCHTPTASRPYCCPECGEQRDHWRSLAMHLWRSHLLDLDLHRPSAANHVGEQTNQRPLYTDGLRVTHVEPSEPSTKPCTQCNYRTFSAFKLENHARIHSEERDFTCAQCGKGFKQLSQLRNHHVVHLDRKNTPHKRWYSQQTCELCQRTFSDSKCLRKHHQAVHGKVKPYVCSFCGHMSARKAMLQLHLRQHTGEKPFACNLCEYRTGDHNSLRRHKMRHSGTKPYKCPHCPYACIQAISYKMHMKNKHPGLDGLYACSLCSFRSVSKENYTNHMSDHKRGFLAVPGQLSSSSAANSSASTEGEGLQLPEGTLQQLEGILPGNLNAAQLIYSCLSALQQEGGTANLPPGVTTYSTGDGTQTITIQVPSTAAGEDSGSSLLPTPSEQDQFYLTVQQQEDGSMAYLSGEGFAQGADVDSDVAGLKISAVHFTESR